MQNYTQYNMIIQCLRYYIIIPQLGSELDHGCDNTALLWQKEATDKSPKSEKVICFIGLSIFYFHSEFGAETLILLPSHLSHLQDNDIILYCMA